MAKTTMTEREREIAQQIREVCSAIVDPVNDINDHKDAAKSLGTGLVNTKLALMGEIAKLSSTGKWLPGEIKTATAYAATGMSNAEPGDRAAKSLSTFLSEMNAVAHPKVRDRFSTILGAVEEAWAEEEEFMAMDAADRPPMPVRKWAQRKYHAVTQTLRAVKNDETEIEDALDVIAWAKQNDPDHNPERVAKRLESVAKTLQGIFQDFGNEDIGSAARYVGAITAKDLLESQKIKLAERAKAERAIKLANTPKAAPITAPITAPAAVQAPAPLPTPEPTQAAQVPSEAVQEAAQEIGAPAEGVFDPLSDILNDVQMIEQLAA